MNHKAGFVTIVGKPNAGKSTLMNALIGEKLSITTNKPQTTRKKILGILSHEEYQIIFVDTPGILKPEYLLQEKMLESIFAAVKDSDINLFILDASEDPSGERTFSDPNTNSVISNSSAKNILIINKIDLMKQDEIEMLIKKFEEKNLFSNVIPISAEEKYNLESVLNSILEILPVHPKYYPDDQLSDENERFFVTEIIREKIFELYREEVPYSTEVIIDEFKERETGKDYILASIVVERESQKPIIIGNKGEAIKRLGQIARRAVEEFLGKEVFLELNVKVKEKWRSDKNILRQFGYDTHHE